MMPVKNVVALHSIHPTPSAAARLTLSANAPLKTPKIAYDEVNAKPDRRP